MTLCYRLFYMIRTFWRKKERGLLILAFNAGHLQLETGCIILRNLKRIEFLSFWEGNIFNASMEMQLINLFIYLFEVRFPEYMVFR